MGTPIAHLARVAELVDAGDLKSSSWQQERGFESHLGHLADPLALWPFGPLADACASRYPLHGLTP